MLKSDRVIQEIFGWKRGMVSASTLSRFFNKYDIDRNDRIFAPLMRYWFSVVDIEKLTVDLDSSVITRYGKKCEAADVGYNPHKRVRGSHHPIIAFCSELQMVINAWMRGGASHTSVNADAFMEETFSLVDPSRIGLLRADVGFYDKAFIRQLESRDVKYIIRAKMTTRLLDHIADYNGPWYSDESVGQNCSYAEVYYKATGWDLARRIVVVRKPKELKDQLPR